MSEQPQQDLPDEQRPNPAPPAQTINTRSEVDEASLESFPASDPPAWTSGNADSAPHTVSAADYAAMDEAASLEDAPSEDEENAPGGS